MLMPQLHISRVVGDLILVVCDAVCEIVRPRINLEVENWCNNYRECETGVVVWVRLCILWEPAVQFSGFSIVEKVQISHDCHIY